MKTFIEICHGALITSAAMVILLAVAGTFGIGNFRLYYGPDPMGCTKMEVLIKAKEASK